MSDDVPTPEAPEDTENRAAARNPWGAPGSVPEGAEGPQYASADANGEPQDAAPKVPLDKAGPGGTIASNEPLAAQTPGPRDQVPPSVHDQRTVTSLPGVGPAVGDGAASHGWASPVTPSASANGSLASFPPPNPATATGGPHPFAPPVVQDGAVPPPPIAPDGPGQVPYGYPGGYGYPAQPGYVGAPGYGWPGMRPAENGMGITAMVLGIVAAGGFCLWPAALVIGPLAIIFGGIGRAKAKRGEATNPGQALAGIICGAAGTVLAIGLLVLVIVAP